MQNKHKKIVSINSAQQKDVLLQKLAGRCHSLIIRKNVIDFVSNVEQLINCKLTLSNDDLENEVDHLIERLNTFIDSTKPSQTDAKLIRFAKICLDKVAGGESLNKLITSKKIVHFSDVNSSNITQETYELAEILYELAELLYKNKIEKFQTTLANNLSNSQIKELHYHIEICKGSIVNLSDRNNNLNIISGILGYANKTTDYYMNNSPYPTLKEIKEMFFDLDVIENREESTNDNQQKFVII